MESLIKNAIKKDFVSFNETFEKMIELQFTKSLDKFLVEKTGDKKEYEAFFKKALKKFGVTEPDQLEGDKKKEFFDYVDKNWDAGDNETD